MQSRAAFDGRRYQPDPEFVLPPRWLLASTCLALPAGLGCLAAPPPVGSILGPALLGGWLLGLVVALFAAFAAQRSTWAPLIANVIVVEGLVVGFLTWHGPVQGWQRDQAFWATYHERMEVVDLLENGSLKPRTTLQEGFVGQALLPPQYALLVSQPYTPNEPLVYVTHTDGVWRALFYLDGCHGVLFVADGSARVGDWAFNAVGPVHKLTGRLDDQWFTTFDDYVNCW